MPGNRDIIDILKQVSVRHVIIKEPGLDIDIYCDDKKEMARQILHLGVRFAKDYKISVAEDDFHIHIDFIKEALEVRFDLIDSLDIYRNEVYENTEYARCAIRLLEYLKCPEKQKHLDYVKNFFNE